VGDIYGQEERLRVYYGGGMETFFPSGIRRSSGEFTTGNQLDFGVGPVPLESD